MEHTTGIGGILYATRRGMAGLGLLGLLIVVAIMFYLYFGPTGPNGKSAVETAKEGRDQAVEMRRQIDLGQMAQVIAAYEIQNDKTPTTLEEMGMENHPSFRDAYGQMVRFEIVGDRPRELVITSAGMDRTFGTEDDEEQRTTMPL